MSGITDEKHDHVNHEKHDALDQEGVTHHENLTDKEIMANAFEAENREHQMGLMEAIKDYPMACFWAFVFCFTIVSRGAHSFERNLTTNRSWNPSTCS